MPIFDVILQKKVKNIPSGLLSIVSQVALNPANVSVLSVIMLIHNILDLDAMGLGVLLPQNFPSLFPLGPSCFIVR